MSGYLLGEPKFKAFDNNGLPLVGGLLYSYDPYTDAPKVTYYDAGLLVANTIPVILDARGEASVYLNGGTKLVLKDAAGVTIWTWPTAGVYGDGTVGLSVKDFGAAGDGVTDDTSAIEAAWEACWVTPATVYFAFNWNPILYFPAGNYVYKGGGLVQQGTMANWTVRGNGPGSTMIQIPSGKYFIDVNYCDTIDISGINFSGGKGAFRQTGTANNFSGRANFSNNWFYTYTECAIGFNTTDKPDIKISDNLFYANPAAEAIGIALSYNPDNSDIVGNSFFCNKYDIKIPNSGAGGTFITRNEFIRLENPEPSYNIWIVPRTDGQIYPGNISIYDNKFGNEHLGDDDVRIIIADEAAGTYNSDKHHATTNSTGVVNGMKIRDNLFETTGTATQPIIYSYTPNVYDMIFENQFDGYNSNLNIINFSAALDVSPWNRMNNFSYKQVYSGITAPVPDPSTSPGLGRVDDPHGYLEGRLGYPHFYPAGMCPSYIRLLEGDVIASDAGLYNASQTPAADSMGGTNAASVVFTDAVSWMTLGVNAASLVVGRFGFIEFDMKAAAANALTELEVDAHPSAVDYTQYIIKRILKVPATWARVRLPFTTRTTAAMILRLTPYGFGIGKTSIIIGRPAIYYAQEPVNLSSYLQYSGTTPSGHVTPWRVGQELLLTNGAVLSWWKSTGLANTNWLKISN